MSRRTGKRHSYRVLAVALVTLGVAACDGGTTHDTVGVDTEELERASLQQGSGLSPFPLRPDQIESRHLVILDDDPGRRKADVSERARGLTGLFGGVPGYVFHRSLNGFSVANLDTAAIQGLKEHPLVKDVHEVEPLLLETGATASWALDRIDQASPSLNGQFNSQFDGSGVHIYVVDSGIDGNHSEFTGRLGNGVSFMNLSTGPDPYIDQNGHGTAVASAAAGATLGVATGATLHSVRINDGNEFIWPDDILAGLEWIADNATHPAVANLNLTFDPDNWVPTWPWEGMLADAVVDLIQAGVVVVKSAGNFDRDACEDEGNTTSAIIVSGTKTTD